MKEQIVFRGDRLRKLRKSRKETQQALADKVNITRTQITNLEAGNTEPSLILLVMLAMELDVSTDYLLDLTDELYHPY